jgi:hypothetical protein
VPRRSLVRKARANAHRHRADAVTHKRLLPRHLLLLRMISRQPPAHCALVHRHRSRAPSRSLAISRSPTPLARASASRPHDLFARLPPAEEQNGADAVPFLVRLNDHFQPAEHCPIVQLYLLTRARAIYVEHTLTRGWTLARLMKRSGVRAGSFHRAQASAQPPSLTATASLRAQPVTIVRRGKRAIGTARTSTFVERAVRSRSRGMQASADVRAELGVASSAQLAIASTGRSRRTSSA